MLKVWTDGRAAGHLDRQEKGHGTVFAYAADAGRTRAISLSMPWRLASYEQDFGCIRSSR